MPFMWKSILRPNSRLIILRMDVLEYFGMFWDVLGYFGAVHF